MKPRIILILSICFFLDGVNSANAGGFNSCVGALILMVPDTENTGGGTSSSPHPLSNASLTDGTFTASWRVLSKDGKEGVSQAPVYIGRLRISDERTPVLPFAASWINGRRRRGDGAELDLVHSEPVSESLVKYHFRGHFEDNLVVATVDFNPTTREARVADFQTLNDSLAMTVPLPALTGIGNHPLSLAQLHGQKTECTWKVVEAGGKETAHRADVRYGELRALNGKAVLPVSIPWIRVPSSQRTDLDLVHTEQVSGSSVRYTFKRHFQQFSGVGAGVTDIDVQAVVDVNPQTNEAKVVDIISTQSSK
jgi:hypothetical protein